MVRLFPLVQKIFHTKQVTGIPLNIVQFIEAAPYTVGFALKQVEPCRNKLQQPQQTKKSPKLS